MFTLDLQDAISWCISDGRIIVKFVVVLENGRKLPIYYVTASSLMGVFENICVIKDSVVEFCSSHGYVYKYLISVSYVQ